MHPALLRTMAHQSAGAGKSSGLGGHDRTWLCGKLLVAAPSMGDGRFKKSVIFMCAHDIGGAMGIVINQEMADVPISLLLSQLSVLPSAGFADFPVLQGGPVETARGLLLHSTDVLKSESITIDGGFAVTGTIEALRDVVTGAGPSNRLFALGYAGWSPGQLEGEIAENAWLVVDADADIVFRTPAQQKWEKALKKLGVDPAFLTAGAGRA